jgi:hypothetical protein
MKRDVEQMGELVVLGGGVMYVQPKEAIDDSRFTAGSIPDRELSHYLGVYRLGVATDNAIMARDPKFGLEEAITTDNIRKKTDSKMMLPISRQTGLKSPRSDSAVSSARKLQSALSRS